MALREPLHESFAEAETTQNISIMKPDNNHSLTSDDGDVILNIQGFRQSPIKMSISGNEINYTKNGGSIRRISYDDDTKDNNMDTQSGLLDDLEFMNDFLEAEANQSWFSLNCWKCNCCNTLKILIGLIIIGGICWTIYYFEKDWIDSNYKDLIRWASIPIICCLFTYFHIWLALEMTFWPVNFWGIYQFKSGILEGYGFGWQGIVPMKAIKMAEMAVDMMVPDVMTMEESIAKLDPKRLYELMEPAVSMLEICYMFS